MTVSDINNIGSTKFNTSAFCWKNTESTTISLGRISFKYTVYKINGIICNTITAIIADNKAKAYTTSAIDIARVICEVSRLNN